MAIFSALECVTIRDGPPWQNAWKHAVGRLIPSIEAKIVDTPAGKALPLNRSGELCIRGPLSSKTEKAFLKEPKVFLSLETSGKGTRLGKGGNQFWKSVGLGFKTPRDAIEGSFCNNKVRWGRGTLSNEQRSCLTLQCLKDYIFQFKLKELTKVCPYGFSV